MKIECWSNGLPNTITVRIASAAMGEIVGSGIGAGLGWMFAWDACNSPPGIIGAAGQVLTTAAQQSCGNTELACIIGGAVVGAATATVLLAKCGIFRCALNNERDVEAPPPVNEQTAILRV